MRKGIPISRIPDIAPEEMTAEQKRVYQEIGGARGGLVRGPLVIWLRNPEIADLANQCGNSLTPAGQTGESPVGLMVLIVARHWSAQSEWFAHEKAGLKAAIPQAGVDAIRERREPKFVREDERLVYDTITELNVARTLSQAAYERALADLGLDLTDRADYRAGFYTMVAMMLNAFDAPVPGGEHPLP